MAGFLFDSIVFGPVISRRLGVSLGINLLPTHYKHCSFNCIYCECGWTKKNNDENEIFPPATLVKECLENKLIEMQKSQTLPDSISFAGNGEPTLHPDFPEIISFTLELRNKYAPKSKVSVLSNATMLHNQNVVEALKKVDKNILKLESVVAETFRLLNKPMTKITLDDVVKGLRQFKKNLIIQTLFVRGMFKDKYIDNTTDIEIEEWIKLLKIIKPELVMIYPIARATPLSGLEKVGIEELEIIAEKVYLSTGLKTEVY